MRSGCAASSRRMCDLSEDALLWHGPDEMLPACAELSFAELRFRGDPSAPAGPKELQRQAHALGSFMTRSGRPSMFGLVTRAEARARRADRRKAHRADRSEPPGASAAPAQLSSTSSPR